MSLGYAKKQLIEVWLGKVMTSFFVRRTWCVGFFLYIVLSIAHTSAALLQENIEESHECMMRALNNNCATFKYLIESLLEDIRSGTVAVADKVQVIKRLQYVHEELTRVIEQQLSIADNEQLASFITHVNNLAQNICLGMRTTFGPWPELSMPTRVQAINSEKQLKQACGQLSGLVKHMQCESTYVGLHGMRRSYRMMCNGLSRVYITPKFIAKSAVAAAFVIGLWGIFHLPARSSVDGQPLNDDGSIMSIEHRSGMTRLLDLVNKLEGNIRPFVTITPVAAWFLAHSFQHELVRTKNWFMRVARAVHCYLKGDRQPIDNQKTYPTRGFEDVRGNEFNKREALKSIEFIVDYERFKQKNISFQRGILLWGKTRTGKTFFAEKMCGEINKRRKARRLRPCPFIQVDAGKMRELARWGNGLAGYIEWAREEAPCVLFIDELHNLLKDDRKVLTELLTGMSGVFQGAQEKPVLIIAATNQPDMLDAALRQKGRFGIELLFNYPHFNERKHHLSDAFSKMFLNLSDIELDAIAHETDGRSYEDLNELIAYMKQEAHINKKPYSRQLFQAAIDHVIRHIQVGSAPLDEQTKKIAAVHHASTLVACAHLSPNKVLVKATLLPVQVGNDQSRTLQQGGVFGYQTTDSGLVQDSRVLACLCKELLAGHVGEKLFFGSTAYSYTHDEHMALQLCKQLNSHGLMTKSMSPKTADSLIRAALECKEQYEQEVLQLLTRERVLIEHIADALVEHETLTGDQITQLLHCPFRTQTAQTCVNDPLPAH